MELKGLVELNDRVELVKVEFSPLGFGYIVMPGLMIAFIQHSQYFALAKFDLLTQ